MELSKFDAAEYLDDEETREAYIEEVKKENSTEALLQAMETVARSRIIAGKYSDDNVHRVFEPKQTGAFKRMAF